MVTKMDFIILYWFVIFSVMGVVRIVISHETAVIGESVISILLFLRLDFIILIIVLIGSGWIAPSASVAIKVVDMISFFTLNPWNRTRDFSAVSRNTSTIFATSTDWRILASLRIDEIFIVSSWLNSLISFWVWVSVCLSSSIFASWYFP